MCGGAKVAKHFQFNSRGAREREKQKENRFKAENPIFTSVEDTKSMDHIWPPSSSYDILEIVATRSHRDMETEAFQVTEFKSEARSDLRGRHGLRGHQNE